MLVMVMLMYAVLKRFRKVKGYTCEDMAKMLKISVSYYCQIENGKRKMTYRMAVKISSIFRMYPDDIFYDYHLKDKVIVRPKKGQITTYSYFSDN